MEPVEYNPEYWLARAEECRALADRMSYPITKQTMLRLATSYERLAQHAEEQAEMLARIKIEKLDSK
jgi:hypothetical protein